MFNTCALTVHGGVLCWGNNFGGQLGDGTKVSRLAPVPVRRTLHRRTRTGGGHDAYMCPDLGWRRVLLGQQRLRPGWHSGARNRKPGPYACRGSHRRRAGDCRRRKPYLRPDRGGAVLCWGNNEAGQLGDGTTTNRFTPVAVRGLGSGVQAITAGVEHTCALLVSGGIKCWGNNAYGQLGDGSGSDHGTPVDVIHLGGPAQQVHAAAHHTCAVVAGGALCWGANDVGQLGDGTTAGKLAPVPVHGMHGDPLTGVLSIAGGEITYVRSACRRQRQLLGRQLLRPTRRRHDRRPPAAKRREHVGCAASKRSAPACAIPAP